MKKLANLIALFILVSVNVLTPVSYAQEVDGEPLFEDEGYFIGGFGDNSSDDELPFSDKKEDVSDEDIVDLPEVVEDTLPSLIDMVVDTVDEHTGEDGDKGIDEGLGENEGGNFTEGDNFEGVETERQAVIDDFSEEVENLEDSLSALDLLNLSIEPEIEIMGTCDEGEIYVPELDTCATRDEEEIVYYWTDENGRGVISIKDPDGDTFLTMMDMNLGATKSGYANNENIRGYYYQWGNNQGVRSVASVNPSNNPTLFSTDTVDYQNYWPGHQYSGLFVYGDDVPDYWNNVSIGGIDQENFDGLWGGLGDLGDTTSIDTFWGGIKNGDTRQGPCPDGYHVPSMGEWNALITYWYNTKNTDKKSYTELNTFDDSSFRTAFLLPLAGYRKYKDSEIGSNSQGDYGRYRSSSPYGSTLYNANFLAIRSEGVYKAQTNSHARGFGASVRCFKDSPNAPETLTITFNENGGELLGASDGTLDQKVASGYLLQQPVVPTKDGATFRGWFEEGSSVLYNFSSPVDRSTTLYAKWQDDRCSEGQEYYTEIGACATRDVDNIAYYWTGDDGQGLISIVSGNMILTMMDKNLGAIIAGTGEDSYGYHFQWGNNHPFEMICTSSTSCADSGVVILGNYSDSAAVFENYWPGHGYSGSIFIYGNNDYWVMNKHYDNLWGGSGDNLGNNWGGINNGTVRQGPCPDGYHVPSIMEWDTILTFFALGENQSTIRNGDLHYFSNSDNRQKFQNIFKLPSAGTRHFRYGNLDSSTQGVNGVYWSSSPSVSGMTGYNLYMRSSNVYADRSSPRAHGLSVRCFKDSPNAPETLTITFNENGGELLGASDGTLDQKVASGYLLQQPVVPTKDGATFRGWFEEGSSVLYNFSSPVDRSTTLYAKWGKDCPEGEEYVESENKCYPSRAIIRDSVTNEIIQINDQEWDDLELYFLSNTGVLSHYTMMDRNMGATEVYNQKFVRDSSVINVESFGYHYQWGNNYGFEPCINDPLTEDTCIVFTNNSGFVSTISKNIWGLYMPSKYARNSWSTYENWMSSSANGDGIWGGSGDTNLLNGDGSMLGKSDWLVLSGRQGPCPDGYYIPSAFDWRTIKTERQNSTQYPSSGDEIAYDLLLPPAGYRYYNSKKVQYQGTNGFYWSSSAGSWAYDLYYGLSFVYSSSSFRSHGGSLRCVKSSPNAEVLTLHTKGGAGVVVSFTGTVGSGKFTALGTPTKLDFEFNGWYDSETGGNKVEVGDTVVSDLYAYWACPEGYIELDGGCVHEPHYVTFDSNGGTEVSGQTIKEGLSAERPKNPRKSGFIFDGWYEDPNFEGEEYDFNLPLTGDITLYAKWLDNGFELKDNGLYQSEDGYYIIDVDDSDYPQGCNTPGLPNPDRYCILSMPSAGGYAPYSGTIFVAPALSDIPISGGGAVDYCDNLTMGGLIWRIPGSHAGNWSSMYNNRDKLINFTAQGSEKPGHYWANNNASIPYQNCTVDGGGCGNESDSNKVLAVRCVSWNAYEVMFETNGGSVVKARGVPINSKIIEPKSELLGYTLKGWYSDEQLAQRWNFEENRVNNDLILYAKRHVNTYTITFDMDGGTGVLIITGDYNSPIGAPSDPVKEGYTFIGWSQPIPPTMPAGDMTIKALWEINQYTITFDMDGGTGVLIITGDYNSPIGAPSDPVKEGYTFIGWSQPIPPTMPAGDMTIKALWKKNGGNWSGRGKVDLGDKSDEHGSAEDTDKGSSKGNSCLDCNQEVFDAHKWAYEHGLTQYKNISEARMDDYLNRSEMAKISSIFATDFLGREPNEGKQKFCSHYSDLWKVDAEMKFFIIQSCELGYMGYMANGVDALQRFRPYTPISLAETSIILSRIVRGNKYAVSENKWYQGHLYAVYENGLIDDISKPFDNITRKDAYTMLYRLNSLINN